MKQSRRISPRVPYDEAIALTRFDGGGRLYARALDLSVSGMQVVCSESCPVGTELRCTLLLPGGPRNVRGRVVRETALAKGLGLAIAFTYVDRSTAAVIDQMVTARAADMLPAKLRVDGVDRTLRCEGRVDDNTIRLSATLPFLRLDGGVDVVLGEQGEVSAAGVISKIALEPTSRDGVPRLALEVELAERERAGEEPMRGYEAAAPPPSRLPPPCGHPLPSVVVSPGLARDLRLAEERPPRRRVHGTAEIARRPMIPDLPFAEPVTSAPPVRPAPPAPPGRPGRPAPRAGQPRRATVRVDVLVRGWRTLRAHATGPARWAYLLVILPAALAVAALLRAI
jgi:hypothetical protein